MKNIHHLIAIFKQFSSLAERCLTVGFPQRLCAKTSSRSNRKDPSKTRSLSTPTVIKLRQKPLSILPIPIQFHTTLRLQPTGTWTCFHLWQHARQTRVFYYTITKNLHDKLHKQEDGTRGLDSISIDHEQHSALIFGEVEIRVSDFPFRKATKHQAIGIAHTDGKQGQVTN